MQWIYWAFLFVVHVSSEETSCREGWYGLDCGLQCSNTCRPLETFPCNKETGKCSEGCKRGFYGPQCERNCSCAGPCIQDTGDCIGDQTQTTLPTHQHCPENNGEEINIWMIVTICLIVLLALMAVIMFCFIRRTSKRATPVGTNDELELIDRKQQCENMTQQLSAANEKIRLLEEKNVTQQLKAANEEIRILEEKCSAEKTTSNKKISEAEKSMKKMNQQLSEAEKKIKELKDKLEAEKRKKTSLIELQDAEEKIKQREIKLDKLVEDHNTTLKNLGLCEQSTYYLFKDRDLKRSIFLQCTWLELDTEKVNSTAAHLDGYGKLSNKPETTRCQQDGSLKHYSGTTTSAPLQSTGSSQYWEVQNNIAFNETIPENETLVDLGFCIDSDRDKERFTPDRKPNCSLKVVSTHKSICFKVFSGKKDECYQPTGEEVDIDDDKVSTFSFNFGLLMHENGKKITFFDLDDLKIIRTVSIDFKGEIWPMFGLASEDRTIMNVTLVCGNAIEMTDEKMTLIKSVTG